MPLRVLDEGRARLHERRPHEHVPAHRERHHEHPELSTCPVVFRDVAHLAEVDLRFIGGRWIVDSHRDRLLAPSERFVREATQRRVRDRNAVSREQLVHPHQTQRWVAAQPLLDAKSMQLELFARRGRSCQRASLYALRDLPTTPSVSSECWRARIQCGLDVAARRLSIGDAVARDLTRTLPGLPSAKNFSAGTSVMPNSRKLIGTSRRRPAPSSVGTLPLLSVVEPGLRSQRGAGPMTLAIGWPHGLGEFTACPLRVDPSPRRLAGPMRVAKTQEPGPMSVAFGSKRHLRAAEGCGGAGRQPTYCGCDGGGVLGTCDLPGYVTGPVQSLCAIDGGGSWSAACVPCGAGGPCICSDAGSFFPDIPDP